MREVVFQALTTPENQKRDFRVNEVVEKDGVIARTQRRCFYFILGKVRIDNPCDTEKLAVSKASKLPQRKRHYYILKTHDSCSGEDKLICKVAGSFFAVCGNEVYCIAFLHSFKISFSATNKTPNNENNATL